MGALDGRVALITGAGQGSGAGVALALAAAGASVAVVGRTGSKLRDIAQTISSRGGRAEAVECDVSRPEQIDSAVQIVVECFGTIDVLVNAAHHNSRGGQLLEVDDADIELLWSTGPRATLQFMRRCHRWLRGGGSVVNFGSATQFAPAVVAFLASDAAGYIAGQLFCVDGGLTYHR
jgi:NAD(P)-dependent dehydrogenase (short-subunit alcohol dehydrogenase family)